MEYLKPTRGAKAGEPDPSTMKDMTKRASEQGKEAQEMRAVALAMRAHAGESWRKAVQMRAREKFTQKPSPAF